MKNRLELKILLLIIAVLVFGFGTYVIVSINRETKALMEQQRDKSRLFSETVMIGIRNVMLSGKAPFARELVSDARENLQFGSLRVYNNEAKEVFQEEGKGILHNAADTNVVKALHDITDVMLASKTENGMPVFVRIEPLANDKECQQCHNSDHRVRGATQLTLHPELFSIHKKQMEDQDFNAVQSEVTEMLCTTLAVGFRNIMVAGEGALMDTLINRSSQLEYIERIHVYDRFGNLHFGKEENVLDADVVLKAIEEKQPIKLWNKNKTLLTFLIPLRNEDRCQVCHGQKSQWRGIIAATIRVKKFAMDPMQLQKQLTEMLQEAVGVCFKSIMLVGKGSYARSFMNEVRETKGIHDLHVYDKQGSERFVSITAKEYGKDFVKQALAKDTVIEATQWIEDEEFLVRYSPLHNDKRCQVCHGDDHTIRGVVGVTTSMSLINAIISKNQIYSLIAGTLTILLVWLVLRIFMKIVVVTPIRTIGDVAQRVGNGDFSAASNGDSKDEIGELARRINEMVIGLRERFHLQKFVSQKTIDAVHQADVLGVKLGGERKIATVFFSDVRGFTAFSEKNEPERVVAMLNTILSKQAGIVKKYGGDIDKFVGD